MENGLNNVHLIDFNAEDGIRSHHPECELCLETFKRGERKYPVMSGSYGLIKVCGTCWACGYVAVNLDILEGLVKRYSTVGVVEIHSQGTFEINGTYVHNTTENAQAWAFAANGDKFNVTDESI